MNQPSKYRVKEFALDVDWYRRRYPEAALAVQTGEFKNLPDYHARRGETDLNSPSPLFVAHYYAARSNYVQRSPGWGLVEDYLRYGADRGLSPHWLFSETYFLEQLPAVKAAVDARSLTGSFIYFLRVASRRPQRPHPLYWNGYVQQLAPQVDVDRLFRHFAAELAFEQASCGPLFDPAWYAARYRDVEAAVGEGKPLASTLEHFCREGIRENRLPIPDLDIDHYISQCLKLGCQHELTLGSGVQHFLEKGVARGIDPNRYFQSRYYVERNPGVVDESSALGLLGPFEHFLALGLGRGYKAAPPLVNLAVDDDSAKALYEKRARLSAEALRRRRELALPQTAAPELSLIIPVCNNFDYTAYLLQQLHDHLACSPGLTAEVIVVDNGSTDETLQLPHWISGACRVIRIEAAVGYPMACNAGARIARGRLLVFMNNDIELTPGCLAALATAHADPSVGAAGGRIVKVNGVLQEAGGIVWRDGSAAGYGRGQDPLAPSYSIGRDVDYCSGCFLSVDSALFGRLAGFAEEFSPGYYEETDLCARIWAEGLRVRYEPAATIYHYEYASFSKGRPETISAARMAKNQRLFAARNPTFLSRQPATDHAHIDACAFRRTPYGSRPRHVVLVEDFMPDRQIGSGFARSSDVVDGLLAQGCWVTVWALHRREEPAPVRIGLHEGIVQIDHEGGFEGYLARWGELIDVVWVCRTHNFRHFGRLLSGWRAEHPRAQVVFDTEAVSSARDWLTRELGDSPVVDLSRLSGAELCESVRRELGGVEFADRVVAVNELDRGLIRQAWPSATVAVLGHAVAGQESSKSFSERTGLLFCGAVHQANSPNLDSLLWFCHQVLPLVRRQLPDCRLSIIGYWDSELQVPDVLRQDGVEFIGAVDDLAPWFDDAKLFVAPTRVAGGIPHKVHQAMAFGLPAVLTPILAAQLPEFSEGSERGFFVARDFSASAFAAEVVLAYTSPERWQGVRATATDFLRRHCAPQVFQQRLADVLNPGA